MFAIGVWNMFRRTDDELPRTNNSVEGWHRSFQCSLSACHPTFWKFLDLLKKEEGLIRVKKPWGTYSTTTAPKICRKCSQNSKDSQRIPHIVNVYITCRVSHIALAIKKLSK